LEKKLGNNVSIAPLTMWRIRRGKDLLLLKTKKQGITIAGKDYLSLINMENLKDVHPDELFSYLFSSIYFLMEYFHPVEKQCGKMENFNYNVSKSMLYCIEVQLYVKGIYEKKKKNIFMNAKDLPGSNNKFLDGIDIAKKIMGGDTSSCIDEPNKLWFLAREFSIMVFRQLTDTFLDSNMHDDSLDDLIEMYKTTNFSFIKNVQYSVLALLKRIGNPLVGISTKKSMEKYLQVSLFYLMLSINSDLSIDGRYLDKACKTLSLIRLFPKNEQHGKEKIWEESKKIILEHWSMACGKNIV